MARVEIRPGRRRVRLIGVTPKEWESAWRALQREDREYGEEVFGLSPDHSKSTNITSGRTRK